VHGAQQLELRFEFHQIIKAIDHRADGRFAANYFVKGAGFFSHTRNDSLYEGQLAQAPRGRPALQIDLVADLVTGVDNARQLRD
jgi:hypothetical protein